MRHPLQDFVEGWDRDPGVERNTLQSLGKGNTKPGGDREHHWTRPYSDLPHTSWSEMQCLVYKPWKSWEWAARGQRQSFNRLSLSYGVEQPPVRYVGAEEIRKKIDQQLKQMEGEAERRVEAEIEGKEFSWPCASPQEMEEWHRNRRTWRMFHDPKWRGRGWFGWR